LEVTMADGTPVLRVREVPKSFGAVAAVRDVSFELYGGEAHALVGENGAGKSTIVKMPAGVHRPDSGSIELNGVPTELHAPADAKAAGIAVSYQEPTLFPDLSVAENIAMGRQPLGRFNAIDRVAMVRQAAQLFARLGVSIESDAPVRQGRHGEEVRARRARSSRPESSASTPSARTARSCSPADRVHRHQHRPVQLLRAVS
jgi:rhamnose transport system ATP-binding protein